MSCAAVALSLSGRCPLVSIRCESFQDMRGGAIMPSRDKLGRATGNFLTKVHPDT